MRFVIALISLSFVWSSLSMAVCSHGLRQMMCPGDKVVDSDGDVGRVVAVNPFSRTVAIYEPSYGRNYNYDVQTVAIGFGCLEGYCVGDSAVDDDGDQGSIVAVNPYSRQVSIYESSYGRVYNRDIQTVALGLGCKRGYCVGDDVVDRDGDNGRIVAVNRFTGEAAVYESTYGRTYVNPIETLSNSNFCATYGERVRTYDHYPFVSPNLYLSKTVHFHMHR